MANIKNFGLSGVSGDVQFGKAGGRVVYDAGSSVFKVTQSDGTTLDNIRVATTPANANDAASKAYVDGLVDNLSNIAAGDSTAIQAELDATQLGAGLEANGGYTANGDANYISTATSLKDADNKLDAALKAADTAYKAADATLQSNINSEAATRLAADNAATTDRANIRSELATAVTNLEAYADQAESDAINAAASYTDGEITSLDANLRGYIDTVAAGKDALAELVDVNLTSAANGDLLMYNTTTSKWENVDVNTTMIDEGDNLYWTVARGESMFDTRLATKSTTDLAEGDNLYYTDARVDAYVAGGSLSALDVAGDAVIDGNLSVGGVLTVSGTGTSTFVGDVSIDGTINVAGDATFLANIAGNTMTMSGDLTVDGDTLLTQTVTVKGDNTKAAGSNTTNVFQVVDSADAALFEVRENGDVTIAGILTVNGAGTSTFAGDVDINGALTVAEGSTFLAGISGNTMTMSGDLTVNGDTLLTQTVEVKSDATLAAADANVNVFHVTSSDGAELFEVRQNGDAVVGGSLTINGEGATLAGGLSAGDITAANASFTGNVSINGNLEVDGDATFNANISGNNMSLSGNLIIGDADTDYVTFNADVNSNIIPDLNLTYDLGSATKKWNNLYVGTVNATTLIGSLTGQVSDISNHEAYIEGLFSVVDNGGDGSLSYANGVITYTGPSAAETRAHFTAGTGVHYANGEFSIGQAVETTSDVTFNDVTVSGSLYSNDITASEVTINGNLVVTGTTTTVNTETIELADNIIVFNSNATGAASQDAGIEIERGDDTNVSLLWDETNNRWTVGGEDFVAANFIGDLTGDVTGTVSSIANHDTDDLAEGSLNLYYTDARVAAYLTANAYATETYVDNKVADKDSFAIRASLTGAGNIGTIVNVSGKTYYVSRIVVDVTTAFDAEVSISDGTNTLMGAAAIEEDVVGTYVAEMDFATATTGGATISLVSEATAGAATVTVEYVQL